MKKIIVSVILLFLIAALVGGYFFSQKKVLIVGTNTPFPPFEYKNVEGDITGFDIEVIRALAKEIGYDDVEIKDMEFDKLIPALQRGEIDVIAAAMTITPERQGKVSFTDSYWETDQSILVKSDSIHSPQRIKDLVDLTVGVQTGGTGADLAESNTEFIGQIKYYDSFLSAITDLVIGDLDAVIVDRTVAVAFSKQYSLKISSTIYTGEMYGFAVQIDNTLLLDSLNGALQDFMKSEEWNVLIEKYFM